MNWLTVSIALSIVLTVVLNVALRVFPRVGDRVGQRAASVAEQGRGSGVYAPWKAMLVISLVATISINLLLWARR